MLPLFMSTCMCLGAMLPLFMSKCCLCSSPYDRRVNVVSVHVQVYVLGVSMLPLFMFICWESQCCPCSCPCVRTINVAYVHVNVYVIRGHCYLRPYQCVCLKGGSMLPPFLSMC